MIDIDEKKQYIIACMQLNTILNMLPDKEKEKIPSDFLEEIKKYRLKNYRYIYDYSKDLKEQEMSDLTREVLYYLYLNYLCNKEEKKEIESKIKFFMRNISDVENKNIKKYGDIFGKPKDNSNKNLNQNSNETNNKIVKYRINYLEKIIKRLKSLFK